MDKKGKPTSLHHYTSMSTLVALLNGIAEIDGRFYFTFHASNAYQMNDKIEGTMLLNKFFTQSKIKTEYQELYTKMTNDEGELYIISLCKSNDKSKYSGCIPMWGMYGNKGNGAILVFDYDKLDEYISRQQNTSINKCQYKNSQGIKELTKKKNNEIKDAKDKVEALSALRLEAFSLKDSHWEYEDEWRILVKSHEAKLKTNNNGAISYTEICIPVNCLRGIIIGPLVEFEPIKRILERWISKLLEKDNSIKEITIEHSRLQIR